MNDHSSDEHDLLRDNRIVEARNLIREAVLDSQSRINSIRPAQNSRKAEYAQLVTKMGELRGSELYFRYLGSGFGNGSLVELADGSVKYDMISGIGVHVCGHSHVGLIDTLVQAAISGTVMQGNLQQNLDSLALYDDLISIAKESGATLEHCFLSTSGAMANENALKILFQSKYPADRMLTFCNNFSGRTMALSQLTDRPQNRDGLPTILSVDYVPFFDGNNPQTSTEQSITTLCEHLDRYPGKHAAMCLELVQGEGGYYTAPREFFIAMCEVLRERDIPIWFDEVQTFGRTSRLFAFQHLKLDNYVDVVTIGKMSQVCATLFIDQLKPRAGLISQTFTGATSSIHAARFILKQFQENGYLGKNGRNLQIHQRFVQHFERIASAHPHQIAGPWGIGGMVAFTVFDGNAKRSKEFLNRLYEMGVIAFLAGANPTRIRMLPPLLAIQDHEIDSVCDVIENVLAELTEA